MIESRVRSRTRKRQRLAMAPVPGWNIVAAALGTADNLEAAIGNGDNDGMATVQEEILSTFYEKLSASESVSKETVDALRALFGSGEKLKPDDFVAVLSKKTSGEAV